MTPRGFIFDQVAELYDRARPGYPEPLFDDVIALSGIAPGGRILEIGCGTGQATTGFARRGFHVVCLEPGEALARIACERLADFPNVAVVPQTFEAWPLEPGSFDLVICAQAFHWLAPDVRFKKSAVALRPVGWLAIFGNVPVFERSPVRIALDAEYARIAPMLGEAPSAKLCGEEETVRKLFNESGDFGPLMSRAHRWSCDYSADEYLDLLQTHSNHRLLPPDQRERLLTAVHQVIDDFNGRIGVTYDARLYIAQKR